MNDRFVRPTMLHLVLLVPIAVLVTFVINVVEILAVVALNEASGFVVVWSEAAWETVVVYVVLLAVLLIAGVCRARVALALLLPVALFVTVLVTWTDCSVVSHRSELSAVGFGYPFDWLIQDQSMVSPPLPYGLSAGSILELPTSVAWGAFTVDLLLGYSLLLGVLLVARRVVRRKDR